MQHGAVASAKMIQEVLPAFDCTLTAPPVHDDIFTLDSVREAYALVDKGCPARVVVAPNGIGALNEA